MSTAVNDILQQFKDQGFRMTKTRTAVLELLAEATEPLSVAEIVSQLSASAGLRVNKTTIYRELAFLKEQHMVRETQFDDGRVYVELAVGDHHHHIRCIQCKRVEDIDVEERLHVAQEDIAQQSKFVVIDHALEFFGLCAQCQ